jgi:hypothetical protein
VSFPGALRVWVAQLVCVLFPCCVVLCGAVEAVEFRLCAAARGEQFL